MFDVSSSFLVPFIAAGFIAIPHASAHLIHPQSVISSCFSRCKCCRCYYAFYGDTSNAAALVIFAFAFCLCHVHFILFSSLRRASASGSALTAWLCRLNCCNAMCMRRTCFFFFFFRFCCVLSDRQPNAYKHTISDRVLVRVKRSCVWMRVNMQTGKVKQTYITNRIAARVASNE